MKKKYKIYFVLPSLLLISILIFVFTRLSKLENVMDVKQSKEIRNISNTNIFFGHRSVGDNIIEGIKKAALQNNVDSIAIFNMQSFEKFPEKYFVHSYIGSNGDPKSKIEDFKKVVFQLAPQNLNIAFMKLCFVDIKSNTNLNNVFNHYVATIESLKSRYPNLIIIHFTVPLTSKRTLVMAIKDFIKGRPNTSLMDNVARNKYNQFLLAKYPANEIFDLAKIESTYPDGKREESNSNGQKCFCLIKDYTDDGGHLNQKGQLIVAEKLISFLAQTSISKYAKYKRHLRSIY